MSDKKPEPRVVEETNTYTFPQEAGTISSYGYIVINGRPCRVVHASTSEAGECYFVAINIFTSERLEKTFPSSQICDVPRVSLIEYMLVNISEDGFASAVTEDDTPKNNIMLPKDEALLTQLKAGFEEGKKIIITVMSVMGEEQICALREDDPKSEMSIFSRSFTEDAGPK